jgi:hypothetical protein
VGRSFQLQLCASSRREPQTPITHTCSCANWSQYSQFRPHAYCACWSATNQHYRSIDVTAYLQQPCSRIRLNRSLNMAEICALIGTIGAVCNIVECINKTINLIGDVRSRWKTAELALLSLTSQLTALRAALQEIQRWLETNAEEMHHQLTMDLDITLSCCQLLTTELEAHLSSLQTESNTPDKIRMVMRGQNANDIQKFIDHQTTALTLLLTACNW